MEILYRVHHGLYVNLTNRCSSACTFCLRQTMDHVGESHSLWLEREPTAQEVIAEFEKWDLGAFQEIVFCGFGEPTCALDTLLEVARWLKAHTKLPLRLNTNGQGSLIAGRDISGELAQCLDTVSISLNHPDPVAYQTLVRSQFGEAAFQGMLDFAKGCVAKGLHVVMTTVDTTITHQEEQQCREICQALGADYRIRPWED
jgi:TatD family-associated radical SAM protein